MGSEDYLALTREVVNEIPAKQLTSNETDALQQMLDFLKQLNDTHIHIGNRKLNLLKEIFRMLEMLSAIMLQKCMRLEPILKARIKKYHKDLS